jgi:hypothetical protein
MKKEPAYYVAHSLLYGNRVGYGSDGKNITFFPWKF